jgi:hypothetical protein
MVIRMPLTIDPALRAEDATLQADPADSVQARWSEAAVRQDLALALGTDEQRQLCADINGSSLRDRAVISPITAPLPFWKRSSQRVDTDAGIADCRIRT